MQYWQEEMKWGRMNRDFGGDFSTYKSVEETRDNWDVGRKFYEKYDHQLADHVHFSTVDDPNTVEIDNEKCPCETRLAIIAGNRSGTFLEMTQCIAELGLGIRRALVACGKGEGPSKRSDWFYDNFWVYDRSEPTQQVLSEPKQRTLEKVLSLNPAEEAQELRDIMRRLGHTVVELSGPDRPGLLKEVADEMQKQGLQILSLAVWTQQVWTQPDAAGRSRKGQEAQSSGTGQEGQGGGKAVEIQGFAAFVLTVDDGPSISHATTNPGLATERVRGISTKLTRIMSKGQGANVSTSLHVRVSVTISPVKGPIHHDRRLHRLLFRMEEHVLKEKWKAVERAPPDNVELDQERNRYCYNQDKPEALVNQQPWVNIVQWEDNSPWEIRIKCLDRLKLAFDIATALADLGLDVIGARMDPPGGIANGAGVNLAAAAVAAASSVSSKSKEPQTVEHLYQVLPAEGDLQLHNNDWRAHRIYDMLMKALTRRHPTGTRVHLENSESIQAMATKLFEAGLTITRARVNPYEEAGTRTHTLYLLRSSNPSLPPTPQELKEVSSRHLGGTMTVDHDIPGSVDSASLTSGSLTYGIRDIESQWSGVAASPSPSSGSRSSLLGRHHS